ncbi:MAG: metal-sulfur cluster assembly factor [Patescibacteria group bacterium]
MDPELNIGIVDLGLIYDVKIKNNTATVIMTLTTPSCPVGPLIIQQIEDRMLFYKGIKKVYIEVVWDPIWTQEMIDPDIRDLMFGI